MANPKKKKKPNRKKRKRKIVRRGSIPAVDIKPEQLLLHDRKVILFGGINISVAKRVVTEILALDKLDQNPIMLLINSPGGSLSAGYSIIDAITGIESPVVTLVTGQACSMAGLISIAGDERWMSRRSIWMAHDIYSGNEDYATKMIYRTEHLKELQKELFSFIEKRTKLSKAELEIARNGELWLNPEQCLKKGIVDKLLGSK